MLLNALVYLRIHQCARRIALCIGLAFIAGAGYYAYGAFFEHRFTTFTAYQLYQSEQMLPGKLPVIAHQYGVRTVVDLRKAEDAIPIEAVRPALKGTRLAYIHLPTEHEGDTNAIRRVLEIVENPANRPVLVHCHLKPSRSVLLASPFQIEIVNWDTDSIGRTVGPLHWCGDFPPDQLKARYLLSYLGNRPKVTLIGPEELML